MKNAPDFDALEAKVREITIATLQPELEIDAQLSLIQDLGFDSLDMIELSFALEEFFGFEFSSRNALEELERRVGDGVVLKDGVLTAVGRELVLERMPELSHIEMDPDLGSAALPVYFTLRTFVRILHDFYVNAPDTCPETGEPAVLDGFAIVSQTSRKPIEAPTGDELLERWLETKSLELRTAQTA